MGELEQNDRRRDQGAGPFPQERVGDHVWEPTEIERGPFERRRSGDRRALDPAEAGGTGAAGDEDMERRRRWGRRKSDVLSTSARESLLGRSRMFVRRFQKPLIGLTLAGAAAPLINAGTRSAADGRTPATVKEPRAARPGEGATQAAQATDLDSSVSEAWAEANAAAVREQTVQGAVTHYNIDSELATQIYDAATRHQIEPDVAYGLVFTESTFRQRAVSNVGARGLTQVMPRTARWLKPGTTARDLYDPATNLDVGFRYLKRLIDRYDGDVETALTAYNRGPGTVDRILKRGGNPDNGYAGKVLTG